MTNLEWVKKQVAQADADKLVEMVISNSILPLCRYNFCDSCPRDIEDGCLSITEWLSMERKED